MLEEGDITILKLILLSSHSQLTSLLDVGFGTILHEVIIREDISHDEATLEIRVDNTSSGRGKSSGLDGPSTNLDGTAGEVVNKVKSLVTGDGNLGDSGLDDRSGLLLSALVQPLRLPLDGERNEGSTRGTLSGPLVNITEVLVRLVLVILLGDVNKVNNRLSSKKLEGVEVSNIIVGPVILTNILVRLEALLGLLKSLVVLLALLGLVNTTLDDLIKILIHAVHKVKILLNQLLRDDVKITHGVNGSLDVLNLLILESTANVENGINGGDVGKEGVTKTLTLGSTADETSNIVDGKNSRDGLARLVTSHEVIETAIRDGNLGKGRINGAERVVFGRYGKLGKEVEKGGLSNL